MYIFNAVKIKIKIGFIVDALFRYFAYLHSLYTVVELYTNIVLIHFERQPILKATLSFVFALKLLLLKI